VVERKILIPNFRLRQGSIFALALNAALNGGLAWALRRRGGPTFDEPTGDSPAAVAARGEILRFVRPQVPVMVFNAVQGQILIFLIRFLSLDYF
jgi:hypothetical protein